MSQLSWHNLVPGTSTVDDAIAELGTFAGSSRFINGVSFDFLDGLVRVYRLDGAAVIHKIRISGELRSYFPQFDVPADVDQLTSLFPELSVVDISPEGEMKMESAGIRVILDANSEPQKVQWLEIWTC